MRDPITRHSIPRIPLVNRVILLIFGTFLTTLIFSITIKYLSEVGLWLGIILSLVISIGGFYYTEGGTGLRTIFWGMLITVVGGTVAFLLGLQFLTDTIGKVV